MESNDLLSYFLPEGILKYFEVTTVNEESSRLTFVLEEKPLLTAELSSPTLSGKHLHSKGFYPPITIQDFPVRNRACYFKVKRRRWIEVDTGEPYIRDWDLIAKGTKMTSEFALFLNRLNR